MLDKMNGVIQKYIAFLTISSLVLGIIFDDFGKQFLLFVPYLFAFMTFASSIRMKFSDLNVFYKAPRAILFCLLILHIIMPVISYVIAQFVFDDPLLIIGFVMLMCVPTGVTSIIWINVGRGDMPLGLAVVMLDTMLAPIIIPATLHFVAMKSVEIDTSSLIIDLIMMIVVPTIIAIILNEISNGKIPDIIGTRFSPFSKLALFSIIFVNGGAISPYMKKFSWELFIIILVVFVVVVSGYIVSVALSQFMELSYARHVSITFLCGMRNISTGVIVATTYFPAKVAMPVAFGMLFQQLLASIVSQQLERYRPQN
ncbi:bile acid:sodium symporter family protein [Macrococcus armenti]|uniref:bile acid:sodium symporter family protein n=1 Tax=Macrococcus armenti TaxID=2875764 RepID=UPI001CCF2352|nr:bile acid:sodium symporter [Macrococcus armenti]UBH15842.1 bile acid:sodium symporter [Macrococcus armenti]UBH18202.1 bile acid:sodium symporter [Macrococcus armenti]UBH20468.1 bile acid:sodium symporter [Macrococcus armenti]